jgi:hypothetical protein
MHKEGKEASALGIQRLEPKWRWKSTMSELCEAPPAINKPPEKETQ